MAVASPRWRLGVTALALVAAPAAAAQPGELIERTLAIVSGQVITLSDVQAALDLQLVTPPPDGGSVAATASRLVERLLVLREVDRYVPPEPTEAQIEARLAAVRSRFPDAAEFTRALDTSGFSDVRLRHWLRDDLRIASYLAQRFAAVSAPADEEVRAYYDRHRDEFAPLSFADAAPLIRQRLTDERRQGLIDDWVADLRRRTPVVELWSGQDGRGHAPH